jgi:hypothetical protein
MTIELNNEEIQSLHLYLGLALGSAMKDGNKALAQNVLVLARRIAEQMPSETVEVNDSYETYQQKKEEARIFMERNRAPED